MVVDAPIDINNVKKTFINNIDPNRNPQSTKIIVAMSGGVDSSTVAAMLKHSGYEVIGVTMLLHRYSEEQKTCCGITDVRDARKIARDLGFPHYSLNFEKEFKKYVIEYFVEQYKVGKTPMPCLMCNQEIKFKYLIKTLEKLDAHYLVTGHYANLTIDAENNPILSKSIDAKKDQTYFLFSSPKKSLLKTRFPLGMFQKSEVRQIAKQLNLNIHSKKESQDLCFVKNNYKDFLVENNVSNVIGNFINTKGEIIGSHNGIHNFTIGQRKGLNIVKKDLNDPLYVIKLNSKTNEVTIGSKDQLLGNIVYIINFVEFIKASNFINNNINSLVAKTRSTQEAEAIKILEVKEKKCILRFKQSSMSITNGQACVIYINDSVVGGGIICSEEEYKKFISI